MEPKVNGIQQNNNIISSKPKMDEVSIWNMPNATAVSVEEVNIEDRLDDLKITAENLKLSESELYKLLEKIGYSKERILSMSDDEWCPFTNSIMWIFGSTKDITNKYIKNKQIDKIVEKVNSVLKSGKSIVDIGDFHIETYNQTPVEAFQKVLKDVPINDVKLKEKLEKAQSLKEFSVPELEQLIGAYLKQHSDKKDKASVKEAINTFDIMVEFLATDEDVYENFYKAFRNVAKKNEKLSKIFNITDKLKIVTDKQIETFLKDPKVLFALNECGYTPKKFKELVDRVKTSLNTQNGIIPAVAISEILNIMLKLGDDYANLAEDKAKNPKDFAKGNDKQLKLDAYNQLLALIQSFGTKKEQKAALELAQKAGQEDAILEIAYNIAKERPDLNIQAQLDELTNGRFTEIGKEIEARQEVEVDTVEKEAKNTEVKTDNEGIGFDNSNRQIEQVNAANEYIQFFQAQQQEAEPVSRLEFVGKQQTVPSKTDEFVTATKRALVSNSVLFARAWAEGMLKIDDLGKDFNHLCDEGVRIVKTFLRDNPLYRKDLAEKWGNSELLNYVAQKDNLDDKEIMELKNLDMASKLVAMNKNNDKNNEKPSHELT